MLPKELMTDTKRRREKSTSIIPDPRSENRQNFLNILLTDPRQKLAEQNIIAAKELQRIPRKQNNWGGKGNKNARKSQQQTISSVGQTASWSPKAIWIDNKKRTRKHQKTDRLKK